MAANDDEAGETVELGERNPLAARANDLESLREDERDWITDSIDRSDSTDCEERTAGSEYERRGGNVDRVVDDAERVAGDVVSLGETRSHAAAFEGVDGIDAPAAALLGVAGVDDPVALVDADASRLADELDVDVTRVRAWQDQVRGE